MAKKNKTKRIFVVYYDPALERDNDRVGKMFVNRINSLSKLMRKDLIAVSESQQIIFSLPRDYDAYLLHFRNVFMSDIISLRAERPDAWIYGLSNAGGDKGMILKVMQDYGLDRFHGDLPPNFFEEIVAQITSGKRR